MLVEPKTTTRLTAFCDIISEYNKGKDLTQIYPFQPSVSYPVGKDGTIKPGQEGICLSTDFCPLAQACLAMARQAGATGVPGKSGQTSNIFYPAYPPDISTL